MVSKKQEKHHSSQKDNIYDIQKPSNGYVWGFCFALNTQTLLIIGHPMEW